MSWAIFAGSGAMVAMTSMRRPPMRSAISAETGMVSPKNRTPMIWKIKKSRREIPSEPVAQLSANTVIR